jgi:uncharacterized protein YfbU (UPF0304 family)
MAQLETVQLRQQLGGGMKRIDLSDGEKLILLMLSEIYDHLEIDGETDTGLVREAIFSGNLWGLEWGMPGVFHDSETPSAVVKETVDILFMWQRLEESFENLAPSDRELLASELGPFGKNVRFFGFDGNNEAPYLNAMSFLIEHLGRFPHFQQRSNANSHMPTLEGYRRMLIVFEPILKQMTNQDFTVSQITRVLSAWRHPASTEDPDREQTQR